VLASIASLECFPEQLPVAPLDALGALDPESGFQVFAPTLLVFLHHGPYARLRRGPLFRVRRRLAGPHQHVPEVGHGRSNEVKESIEVSSTQGQHSAMDIISLHIVIPADDLETFESCFGLKVARESLSVSAEIPILPIMGPRTAASPASQQWTRLRRPKATGTIDRPYCRQATPGRVDSSPFSVIGISTPDTLLVALSS
jgi:hypothetical protein